MSADCTVDSPDAGSRQAVLAELYWTLQAAAEARCKEHFSRYAWSSGNALGRSLANASYLGVVWLILYWIGAPAHPSRASASWFVDPRHMPFWELALIGAWCLALFVLLIRNLRGGRLRQSLSIMRSLRPLAVLETVPVLACVIAVALLLREWLPWLDRSWLNRLGDTGVSATNIGLIPVYVRVLGLPFLPLLMLNLPLLAADEEQSYRKGTHNWLHALFRSLRFGLAHCWCGVPLYAGLALSVTGLWLSHHYFRGGVERSTVRHAAYNLVICGILYIVLWQHHLTR